MPHACLLRRCAAPHLHEQLKVDILRLGGCAALLLVAATGHNIDTLHIACTKSLPAAERHMSWVMHSASARSKTLGAAPKWTVAF